MPQTRQLFITPIGGERNGSLANINVSRVEERHNAWGLYFGSSFLGFVWKDKAILRDSITNEITTSFKEIDTVATNK